MAPYGELMENPRPTAMEINSRQSSYTPTFAFVNEIFEGDAVSRNIGTLFVGVPGDGHRSSSEMELVGSPPRREFSVAHKTFFKFRTGHASPQQAIGFDRLFRRQRSAPIVHATQR